MICSSLCRLPCILAPFHWPRPRRRSRRAPLIYHGPVFGGKVKAYLEHLKSQGKKERTVYTYGKDLQQIEAFFGADRKLKGILAPHVGKFFRSDALLKLTSGKQRAEPTVKKTMRVLRMFLVWAKETGRIDKLPLPKGTTMGRSVKKEGDQQHDDERASAPAGS